MTYSTNLTAIILEVPTALFILYLVVRSKFTYQASGVVYWLMIVIGFALGVYAINCIFVFTYDVKLINSD